MKTYRKHRADGRRAIDALRAARHDAKMADAEYPRYVGDDVTIELPHGERLVMRLEPDEDYRQEEYEIEWHRSDYVRQWPDWWLSRDNVLHIVGDRRGEYATVDLSSTDYDPDTRGLSRHAAWLRGREMRTSIAGSIREGWEHSIGCGYVVTLADEEESCWGFDDSDYAGQEAWGVAQYMIAKRAEYWRVRVIEERTKRETLRAKVRALVAELRTLRHVQAPTACAELHSAMSRMRAAHSQSIQEINA